MNLELLFALISRANKLGIELTESGAPKGERRMYHLNFADGRLYENSLLSMIEKELDKYENSLEHDMNLEDCFAYLDKEFGVLHDVRCVPSQNIAVGYQYRVTVSNLPTSMGAKSQYSARAGSYLYAFINVVHEIKRDIKKEEDKRFGQPHHGHGDSK